ncbi:MAG: serine/threonine protein kinase [Deltaproteobacteria bacterium]|nr:serine/threonine protein kinase [Deltaproteobacteria bacterium]
MGVVYQAHDPQLDRLIALKVLRQDRVTSEDFVMRFLKEARALGWLSHPNIVTVYDVGQDHETIYIAMEYLEGSALNELIKENNLNLKEVMNIGIQVAQALDYAHGRGIVHRDIKPSNIIVTKDGQVKITDFGIAHIEDPAAHQQTQAGEILGTPIYMSPEQVMGQSVDGRSDLYSLGVIIYELVTGKRPFAGENLAAIFRAVTTDRAVEPAELDQSIPLSLSGLIMQALNKSPDERFQSGAQMAECFSRFVAEQEDPTMPREAEEKKPSHLIRNVFIAAIVVALAFGVYLFTGSNSVVTASLQVESMPEGAQVFIDSAFKGKTPLELDLPLGKHEVRLSLPNYYEWEAQMQLDKEGQQPLFVRLISAETTLEE